MGGLFNQVKQFPSILLQKAFLTGAGPAISVYEREILQRLMNGQV
jgi:hypothetical protein